MPEKQFIELLELAKQASAKAYAPYSKFLVGASVLYESGKIYTGCNVENSSYGLSLCAERNALSTAIANGEKTKPLFIAIYSPNTKNCVPCGACRQWMAEFSTKLNVIVEDENSQPKVLTFDEILPNAFDSSKLEN